MASKTEDVAFDAGVRAADHHAGIRIAGDDLSRAASVPGRRLPDGMSLRGEAVEDLLRQPILQAQLERVGDRARVRAGPARPPRRRCRAGPR